MWIIIKLIVVQWIESNLWSFSFPAYCSRPIDIPIALTSALKNKKQLTNSVENNKDVQVLQEIYRKLHPKIRPSCQIIHTLISSCPFIHSHMQSQSTFTKHIIQQFTPFLKLQQQMRNSNSRGKDRPYPDKTSNQNQQKNRNVVTQPPKTPSTLESTNLNIAQHSRKSATRKPVLPKPQSKIQYNVEVNMTESKIFKAKQGLQLLKKKMNRTGMSRQKSRSTAEKIDENQLECLAVKKMISQPESKTEKEIAFKKNKQIPRVSKENEIPNDHQITEPVRASTKKTSSFLNKSIHGQEDRPISKQVDFMELLQKEMIKQEKEDNQKRGIQKRQINKIYNQKGEQIILHQCTMGCGRMFNPQVIQKHEKICQKVFQSKRKAFDSSEYRQIEGQPKKAPELALKKVEEKCKPKNEIPKWKLQSAKLRAGIKLGKNEALSKQEENAMNTQTQEFKQCPYCGRKFNQKASQKHIAFCQRKSKQMPKITLGRKK